MVLNNIMDGKNWSVVYIMGDAILDNKNIYENIVRNSLFGCMFFE